jgi:hypothetical protein
MRQSVSKGQRLSEGFARRKGSVKRINLKVRARVRRWVEGNGAHVHVTVNMSLELSVEFGVNVGGGKGSWGWEGQVANA